jgi:CHAT domain-containing protein
MGLVPVEVAGYTGRVAGRPADLYAAVWTRPKDADLSTLLHAGVPSDRYEAMKRSLAQRDYFPSALHCFRGSAGQVLCSGVWRRRQGLAPPWQSWAGDQAFYDKKSETLRNSLTQEGVCLYAGGPEAGPRWLGLWHESTAVESRGLYALSPAEHLKQCRRLAAQGYRPVSVSVLPAKKGQTVAASVWQRPLSRDLALAYQLSVNARRLADEGNVAAAVTLLERGVEVRNREGQAGHAHLAADLHFLAGLHARTLEGRRRAETLYSQALAIRKRALDVGHADYEATVDALAALYQAASNYEPLVPLYRERLEARKAAHGEQHPAYARALVDLARALQGLKQFDKAEPLLLQARDVRGRSLGTGHAEYADSLHRLAALYHDRKQYDRAEPLYLESLAVTRKSQGETHPAYAERQRGLVELYRATRQPEKIEALYRQTAQRRKSALGERDPHYAAALHDLGSFYHEQGQGDRAEPLLRQARTICLSSLADRLQKLALEYLRAGQTDKAGPPLEEALATLRKLPGRAPVADIPFLVALGNLYSRQGKHARAAVFYAEVRDLRKRSVGEDHDLYADSVRDLARACQAAKDFTRAEPLFRETVALRRQKHGVGSGQHADALYDLGAAYLAAGKHAQATSPLNEYLAASRARLGEGSVDYARSLYKVAGLHYEADRPAPAEPLLLTARDIFKQKVGTDSLEYADAVDRLGRVYVTLGRTREAAPLLAEGCAIREKRLGPGTPRVRANLRTLAGVYGVLGQKEKSRELYLRAHELTRKAVGADTSEFALSLRTIAALHLAQGKTDLAEKLLLQSRAIVKKALGPHHLEYAESLQVLASLYQTRRDYARAEPLYLEAYQIIQKAAPRVSYAHSSILNSLGSFYFATGEVAKAQTFFRQEAEVKKKLPNAPGSPWIHESAAAHAHVQSGEYEKAAALLQKMLAEIERNLGADSNSYFVYLLQLVSVYQQLGQTAEAHEAVTRAIEIAARIAGEDHPLYALALVTLSNLCESLGQFDNSEMLLEKVRAINEKFYGADHPEAAGYFQPLARVYLAEGKPDRAVPLCRTMLRQNLDLARNTLPWLSEAQAVAFLTNPYRQHARDLLLSALRPRARDSARDVYAAVWDSRALLARTLARRQRLLASAPMATPLAAELARTRQELAQLTLAAPEPGQGEARHRRLARLNEDKERLEKELARLGQETGKLPASEESSPADLARHLADDEAVVDIVEATVLIPSADKKGLRIDSHYDAFILTRRKQAPGYSVVWQTLGPTRPIDDAIENWREHLVGEKDPFVYGRRRKRAAAADSGREGTLKALVWDRIEPHLGGRTTVVILPEGRLTLLPWAALPGKKPGTLLLDSHAIGTASHGQHLVELLTRKTKPEGNLLLVGGVDYGARPQQGMTMPDRRQWRPLPATVAEIEAIAGLWQGQGKPAVLTGKAAGELALRRVLPGARFAHLATHGFFADDSYRTALKHQTGQEQLFAGGAGGSQAHATVTARNPLILSGIVLSGANLPPQTDREGLPMGEDGILTAEEVASLRLERTELVVLSACETGIGTEVPSEGVFGLQRAFALAGARTTVASLWEVGDDATRALMLEFYQNLWQRKMSKLKALCEAQRTLAQRYDPATKRLRPPGTAAAPCPPFFWAAFVLNGDWR